MKVLIVEDNILLRENTVFLLKKLNFFVDGAENGEEAFLKVLSYEYDVIVLDINMPVMNGKEFLTRLRSSDKTIAVIALTSNAMLSDKLEVFDLWADDYITKPFEVEELAMRIKAVWKRWNILLDTEKLHKDVTVNFSTSKVYLAWKEIYFSHKQYLIIEYLMKNIWYPKNKLSIMEYVWWEQEENLELGSTTLESHIYAVRSKLWKNFIRTQKGVWYIID